MSTQALKAATIGADVRKAGKQIASQAGGATVAAFFEANKASIQAVLPAHIKPERMLKIALGAIRQVPQLLECTVESLFGATVLCSQLGLEPNTPMGQAYLIPFRNRKKGITEVQFIAGYKGLIDLARRSGQIESISARVVHENDDFDIQYGTVDEIMHRPALSDRGRIIGFYAVAKLKDGGKQFEFMSKAEIDIVMAGTQSKGAYGPWKDNYQEMGRKTVIRRLTKYLPMSIELATAAAVDARGEIDHGQALDNVLSGEYSVDDPEAPQASLGHEGEVIDTATGEVLTESHGVGDQNAPSFTFGDVAASLKNSVTRDQLDEAATLISTIPNPVHREQLNTLYEERAAALQV